MRHGDDPTATPGVAVGDPYQYNIYVDMEQYTELEKIAHADCRICGGTLEVGEYVCEAVKPL